MSYLTQMLALTVQNFFSAASGIAVVYALIRGFVARSSGVIGNVWADLTRVTLYVLLPLSLVFAVFLVGAILVEAQNVLREVPMLPGHTQTIGRYAFRFDGVERVPGPNYMADRGHVQVFRDDRPLVLLHPEKRAYASGGQVMTDAGIHAGVRADIFVALGEPLGGDAWAVRLHVKPFVRWIWAGALLMALGGFVTAADRRFRLPLPREAR
jgi:cytochrome c-type biogenesis protein CcmF